MCSFSSLLLLVLVGYIYVPTSLCLSICLALSMYLAICLALSTRPVDTREHVHICRAVRIVSTRAAAFALETDALHDSRQCVF